jgi:hypothetical protein
VCLISVDPRYFSVRPSLIRSTRQRGNHDDVVFDQPTAVVHATLACVIREICTASCNSITFEDWPTSYVFTVLLAAGYMPRHAAAIYRKLSPRFCALLCDLTYSCLHVSCLLRWLWRSAWPGSDLDIISLGLLQQSRSRFNAVKMASFCG